MREVRALIAAFGALIKEVRALIQVYSLTPITSAHTIHKR